MKKIFSLMLILFLFGAINIISCKKPNDTDGVVNSNIKPIARQ